MYKVEHTIERLQELKDNKIELKEFNRFISTADEHRVELTDQTWKNIIKTILQVRKLNEFLKVWGYYYEPYHCLRDTITHNRLKGLGLEPSEVSLHRRARATDGACFCNGDFIAHRKGDHQILKSIGKLIYNNKEMLGIVEVKVYSTFIHIGFLTEDQQKVKYKLLGV